jgi:hypothetical protein
MKIIMLFLSCLVLNELCAIPGGILEIILSKILTTISNPLVQSQEAI